MMRKLTPSRSSGGQIDTYKVKVSGSDTTASLLQSKLSVTAPLTLGIVNPGANESLQIGVTDLNNFVGVDASDSTPSYLTDKLVVGAGLTKTILNPGAVESIQLVASDPTVLVSTGDTTKGTLSSKLAAGSKVALTIINPGADEDLSISAADPSVVITANDTTANNLFAKVTAGAGITKTVLNPGANEELQLVASDPSVLVSAADTTKSNLNTKIGVGTGITKTILNPGANEQLVFSLTTASATKVYMPVYMAFGALREALAQIEGVFTAGAGSPLANEYRILSFDQNQTTYAAIGTTVLPRNWDGTTVYAHIYWSNNDGSHGQAVKWNLHVRSIRDLETLTYNESFTEVQDTDTAANILFITSEVSVTLSAVSSARAGDMLSLMIRRNTDSSSGVIRLLGVVLYIPITLGSLPAQP